MAWENYTKGPGGELDIDRVLEDANKPAEEPIPVTSVIVKEEPKQKLLDSRRNLGTTTELGSGFVETVLDIRGDDKEASMVTVVLWIDTNNSQEDISDKRAVAIVDWGIGGFTARAEVDFSNGMTFTLPASSLQVRARNESLLGVSVKLGAFAGYQPRGGSLVPQRTIYVDDFIAPFDVIAIVVPKFAKNVIFYRFPEDEFSLFFFGNEAAGLAIEYSVSVGFGQQMDKMLISNDTKLILLQPIGAGGISRGRFIFELAL